MYGGCGSSTRQRTLPANTTTLTLAHSAPNAELLAVTKGELEAVLSDNAATADFFGFTGACPALWEEEIRIDAKTVGHVLPRAFIGISFVVQSHGFLRQSRPDRAECMPTA